MAAHWVGCRSSPSGNPALCSERSRRGTVVVVAVAAVGVLPDGS